ncbi:hypothetical protein [aff. Roholtiella sp. LEGE 12411]|nr:hypothetical protein [aff. Roholtiella sp. LEGE 12411]
MDGIVVVALVAYVVLFCMAFYVVQGYMEESRQIARRYRKSHQS